MKQRKINREREIKGERLEERERDRTEKEEEIQRKKFRTQESGIMLKNYHKHQTYRASTLN